jgi:hypothetical protein
MKVHPVGAELFHMDWQTNGQTDMTNIIVTFRNFAKAPNNEDNKNPVFTQSVQIFCQLPSISTY